MPSNNVRTQLPVYPTPSCWAPGSRLSSAGHRAVRRWDWGRPVCRDGVLDAPGALAAAAACSRARNVPSSPMVLINGAGNTTVVFLSRSEEHTSELQSLRHL